MDTSAGSAGLCDTDKKLKVTADAVSLADVSTGTPENQDNSDDNADMVTESSSKLSKSRRMDQRGPKRAAKNQDRLMKHLAKQGKQYHPRSEDSQANAETATGLCGSVAKSMHHHQIEEKRQTNLTEEEKTQKVAEDIKEGRNFDPILDSNRFVVMREGAMHCTLCNKIADQSHLGSLGHLERMEEDAIATLMAGKTTSTRRLVDGKLGRGCMGVPTKKGIMKHWGDELFCLPMEAKKRHQDMGDNLHQQQRREGRKRRTCGGVQTWSRELQRVRQVRSE